MLLSNIYYITFIEVSKITPNKEKTLFTKQEHSNELIVQFLNFKYRQKTTCQSQIQISKGLFDRFCFKEMCKNETSSNDTLKTTRLVFSTSIELLALCCERDLG